MADGTSGPDNIPGTNGPDAHNGLGGNDTISGGAGNDTLDGGADNDSVRGGADDDSISGGTGEDALYGDAGNDTILGGDGNDVLVDYEGTNSLSGGAGDDYFPWVGFERGQDTLTGGTGRDTYNLLQPFGSPLYVADIITDFTPGTAGDVIRLADVNWNLPAGANPFLTGYLRLVQVAGNVELQGDANGGGNSWKTLLILQNATASAFTGANFDPGYNPTGAGEVIIGGDGANGITGTVNDDTISGGGGADTVDANGGNDSVDGGSGADSLFGDYGNDTITGGTGSDSINGGEGNDSLAGGEGQDRFYNESGNDTVAGGDGDDYFEDYTGANSVSGGAGADYFEYVSYGSGADTLTGGAGSDVYRPWYPFSAGYVADTITDFQTGTGGDVIRLDALNFSGLPSGANPFTSGYLRLVQVGANAEFQGDQNGGGDSWQTLLILTGVNVANFVGVNFDPPYSPSGTGLAITGSDGANGIVGSPDGDTISGLGGNDTIDGNAGADSIDGGAGDDYVRAEQGNDTVLGSSGADNLGGGEGDDTVDGGIGNDTIYGEAGNDSLVGGDGDDRFANEAGDDTYVGGEGNDYFEDQQGANSFSGGAGSDYFEYVGYGSGEDTFSGGTGSDTYRLYYPVGYVDDIVTDFQTGAGGDVIDIGLTLTQLTGYAGGTNPFTSGYMRLLQSGANVLLQADSSGGGDSYETILVLQNTTVASFTSANFTPAYSPTGTGLTITGSEGANGITGTVDGDTISGGGGNDTVRGDSGNDSIDGGAGDDRLEGDLGNDTILGGAGNDQMYGEGGNDSLVGGEGDDTFNNEDGNDTFVGGEGNDSFGDYLGANSVSGGAGEDFFQYVSYQPGVDTLTGGAGSDFYNIYYPLDAASYAADIVTDFATGAGGDVISIDELRYTGLAAGANPFTNGYLRLTQSGTSVLLEADQDGGGNTWRTILVLQNTTVANFTAANFQPAYSPTGTGLTITGSEGANGITGGLDGDTISGLGGNDTISGSDGNDSVDGGTGDDSLYGNNGNDTVVGGTGNDRIFGEQGNDSLVGGEGDDAFANEAGDDTFIGGDGNDRFDDYTGANSMSGGAGEDLFQYVSYQPGVDTLTGGAGSDVYNIYYPLDATTYAADIVTDFATGAGGDVISIDELRYTGLAAGANPFTNGYLRLTQSGTSVLLEADQDGGGNAWRTILVLQNTTVANFTAANFQPAYSPTGTGLTITGSDGANGITGGLDGDTISGLGGNDTLNGSDGNDSIDGGTGNDALFGNNGNDTLAGGTGVDQFYGGEGNDSLVGGEGDDSFYNDSGNDTLVGGEGNDYFDDYAGANSISGGAGDDFIYVSYQSGVDTVSGGTGTDTFAIYFPFSASYVPDIVTDFQAGAGGDLIKIDQLGLSGLAAGANPFTTGHLRLLQSGADTLLQGDQNGGGDNYRTILVLQNTTASAVLPANFLPNPAAGAGVNQTGGAGADPITGTEGADTLRGAGGNDTLTGLGGNDQLFGNADNDSLIGGDGNDGLYGEAGDDALAGDRGDDYFDGGQGTDTLTGGAGRDTLYGGTENDSLVGDAGNDNLYGQAGNDTLVGGDGDDLLDDTEGANSQSGGAGDDYFRYVSSGFGTDTLTGGTGRDTYNVYNPFGNTTFVPDIVTDFATGAGGDVIDVSQIFFSGLGDANPFTGQFLRLVQNGTSVELQGDQNGGGDSWRVILVLQNTTVANFTSANFSPAYSPTGTGQAIPGSAVNDVIYGTPDGDTITGLDGNDTLYGEAGNDSVDGGAGADTLYGFSGNDTLAGGAGSDRLYGEGGNDSLSGGDGNDSFANEAGNDTFAGGDGSDYFEDYTGANSVSGGAGEDFFQYVSYGADADTLTGGAGSDVFRLYFPFSTTYVPDIVTDFATGAGGDVIRLDALSLSGLEAGANPFTTGHLRLVQNGTGVELQGDQDGGGNSWRVLLVMQNTTLANFTAANFDPAYSPAGAGQVITGTVLVDTLVGTADGDTITGLDGNDTIDGNAGADSIDAGGGADTVYGEEGNDTAAGGAGNDRLYGQGGNDSLSGGDGNDTFDVEVGDDTFDGGAGDDYLGDYQGANSLSGGAGADYFEYVSYGSEGVDTLTGGAGSDVFRLYFPFSTGYVADIVTDFATGVGGDVIRLDALSLALPAGANPFSGGFLRLVQNGTSVELQGDQNGGGDNWRVLLVLQNTTVANFVAANFSPAYGPTGLGETITGTILTDNLVGTLDGDSINGLDGSDAIDANAGADTVNAGAGNDTVYGDEGADSIEGGIGSDSLYGGGDNDTVSGGADNDRLYGEGGNDSLSGGDGQDSFGVEVGNDTFLGGDGDDYLGDYQGVNSLSGGAGADYFEYVSYGSEGVDTLTGGAGSDVFRVYFPFSTGYVADVVTDFATGTGGDVIRLDAVNFTGLDAGANPFTAGYLRLVQTGTSVELQGDQDGGGNSWRTLLVMQNTTVANFTRANFDPGYSPTGVGEVITGTPLVDSLVGTADGDTISGLESNDTIDGNAGADSLSGGAGADSVYGELGNDTIDGGDGNDYVYGQQGNDSVSGGEGQDTFQVEEGNDTFRGGGGDDRMGDYQGANVIDGGAGEDYFEYVSYSDQLDTLTGGAGADTFNLYFPFATGYVADIVTDFTPGADGDEIRLSNLNFSNLASGANPFLTGHLRLIQSGADTLLQGDQNGGGDAYRTLLVLQNVSASALTGVNFDPAYDPTGVGITFIGTPNGDSFAGSVNADSAEGRAGNDTLNGNAGADTILGEGGNDVLYGDLGNDSIDGGADNDTIYAGANDDTVIGGDGADVIYGESGADNLSTGSGDDIVYGGAGSDTILAGDGADRIYDYEGANSISGGIGADVFEYVSFGDGVDTLTGGAGSDAFVLYSPFGTGYVADIVTDFATGAGGDVIRLSSANFSGLAAGTNPFSAGYLRLVQVGSAVELQGDQDGGGNAYRTLLVLQNTSVANFTTANFDPAYDPAGVSPPNAVDDAITASENGVTETNVATLLANDTDPNGDTVTLTNVSATSAAGAAVTLITTGTPRVAYNPGTRFDYLRAGQTATDTYTYTASDGNGGTDTATVTVTITGANDAPTAVADGVSATENGATTIAAATLLANDVDPDSGDTKTLVSVNPQTSAQGASVTLNGSGDVVYNPGNIFNGLRVGQTATDSFTYTMRDAAGVVSSATVTVSVQGANDAPTAVADSVNTSENSVATFLASTLLANDTDIDVGDSKAIQSVSATSAAGAAVSLNGQGNVVYNPGNLYNGLREGETATDTFTYTMVDGGGATSSATVTVTITGGNDAPVAVADTATASEDGTTTILASALLANDTDPDAGDSKTLTVVSATSSQGASVSLNASGNVVYDPGTRFNSLGAGQTATDTFTYTVQDGAGASSSATVTVTITGANDAPTAGADSVSGNEDGSTTIAVATLLANDGDPDSGDTRTLQSVSATSAAGAAVSLSGGNIVYNPGSLFNGLRAGQSATDTFTYVMRDAAGLTSSATVTVVIQGANDAPTAVADGVTVAEDATSGNLVATLLGNDTDPDTGDAKTILAVDTTGTRGTVTFDQAAQTLFFTADDPSFDALNPGQTATTTFTYTMRDGSGTTSTATVTVTVTGVDNDTIPNRAPDAVNDTATVGEDGASTILSAALLGNDTDPDSDPLSIQSVSATSAQGASVSLNGSGNVVYNPGTAFNGLRAGQTATDSFTYTVSDGRGGTDTATVSVTITGANDAPTAVADTATASEDGATTILGSALLANDTDPDTGDTRTIQSVSATSAAGAAVSLNGSGNVVYNPGSLFNALRAGQTATDTFSYTMVDGSGATSSATVTVTINGANDAPTANLDAVEAGEDGATTFLGSAVLANDTDPDAGDTLTIVSVPGTLNSGATVSLVDGNIVYDLGTRFNYLRAGQTVIDSFNYTIRDAAGATSTAAIAVTINGANDAPTAVVNAVSVIEDATSANLVATLLANDTDPDTGDTRRIISVDTTGTLGTVNFNPAAGTLTFSADDPSFDALNPGQSATTSFTYTIRDIAGAQSTATVNVTIIGVDNDTVPNGAPDAVNDGSGVVGEDGATTILPAALLANDTDPDGDPLTIQAVSATSAQGASVSLSGGNVVYNPGSLFNGLRAGQDATDSFTYTVSDGRGGADTATVTLTIRGANDAPTAVADGVTVAEDATSGNLVATLLGNDTDPDSGDSRSIQSVDTTGTRGTVAFDQAAQTLTFTADDPSFDALNPGETATTSFTYTVRDGSGATSNATVTMTVTGVDNDTIPNRAPDAVNDTATVGEDGASTILSAALLGNDTDPDSDPLTIQSVSATSAQGASVSLNGSGNVVYNPGTAFNGLRAGQSASDSFTYTVSDGRGGTDTATVSVTITGANDAPTAVADTATASEDGATTILGSALLANDTDPDTGDTRTIQSVSATSAAGAAVSLNGSGNVVYNPGSLFNSLRAGQTATDTFSYTMVDGSGATSSATVTVTINGANDAPDAVNDSGFSTASGTPLTIATATLLANDTDPDAGTVLTVTAVQGATNGTVALNGNQVVFTPNAGYSGAASFTYSVSDGQGGGDTATVSLTVQAQGTGLSLRGTPGDDILTGGAFNDVIFGRGGDDLLTGNGGGDQFRFFGNHITGASDRDTITDLDFLQGDTIVFGSYAPSTFFDMDGVNGFTSGTAASVSSWTGIVNATNASTAVTGARAAGDPDNFVLIVTNGGQTQEIEIVDGWARYIAAGGTEGVAGRTIRGTAGDDALTGGGGSDRITGRGGDDTLTGNAGADQFRFFGNEIVGASDRDRITDLIFGQGDALVFGDFAPGTFSDAAGVTAFDGDGAAIVKSWEGIVNMVDDSALVTAARDTPGGSGLLLILTNGGQTQEILIANGWADYVSAGGTEGLI